MVREGTVSALLSSKGAKLLREAHRLGARFDLDGETLVIEPETVVPERLRQKLFACEKEAVDALRNLIDKRDMLQTIIAAMEAADQFGTRYLLVPGPELVAYSTKAALPQDTWAALRFWHQEIADVRGTLGVVGPVELADVTRSTSLIIDRRSCREHATSERDRSRRRTTVAVRSGGLRQRLV